MSQSLPDMVRRETRGPRRDRQPEQPIRRTKRHTAQVLSTVPLFAGFSRKHLEMLAAQADEQTFRPKEDIVIEGQLGETLYVILEGEGKVTARGKKLGDVIPGDFFGELSAIDGGPRSATVTAVTPMTALRLFRRTLMDLIQHEPQISMKLMDGMAARLRRVDRQMR